MTPDLYFAIPGALDTLTGGYLYDRHLLAGLRTLGLQVEHVPLPGSFPLPDAAALRITAEQFAALPDDALVLVDGLAFGVLDTLAQQHCKRLKLIALCHHPLALESGLTAAQAMQLHASETRALAASRAILVTSPGTAGLLVGQFNISASKITVARPGTQVNDFASCTGDPLQLLTVATLTRRKAHDVLIQALAMVAELPWQAHFIGGAEFDPPWAASLHTLVLESGLQDRIHFHGSIIDLHPWYLQADLFVLPSLFEGYGMAAAEALAHGLPIVAARAGAVPDVVPDSAGILVPPADVAALGSALRTLLTQPALRSQLQQGARLAAARLPGWQDTAQIVATLIRSLQ